MPRPRFTTLQLLLLTTLVALLAALFTSAWRLQPQLSFGILRDGPCQIRVVSGESSWLIRDGDLPMIPIHARVAQIAPSLFALAMWAAAWGIVRNNSRQSLTIAGKRGRESLA